MHRLTKQCLIVDLVCPAWPCLSARTLPENYSKPMQNRNANFRSPGFVLLIPAWSQRLGEKCQIPSGPGAREPLNPLPMPASGLAPARKTTTAPPPDNLNKFRAACRTALPERDINSRQAPATLRYTQATE